MISTGHWTRLDLACVLGLERMGDNFDEIALTMGRSHQDVQRAYDMALMLMAFPDERPAIAAKAKPASKKPEAAPKRKPAPEQEVAIPAKWQPRKFRVSKEALRFLPEPERDVTAAFFGDPDPDRFEKSNSTDNSGDRR